MSKRLLKGFLLGACVLVAPGAWAATDGTEGETSTGTSDISVEIPKLVKIIGIADLYQYYTGGPGGFDQNDDVCIYSNMDTGTGTYSVTITGGSNPKATSPSAGFYVGNASTDQEIPYTVAWNDVSGTSGESSVSSGVALTGQNGFTNDATCGVDNANFHVQMAQVDLLGVRPQTYQGTITILITPE